MRITVNLSQFFSDHRKKARIFIGDNLKFIKDLEKRISEIFAIDHFYLKGEDNYLPPGEDIRLLHYDDIIWAVPSSTENKLTENPEQDITGENSVQIDEATENRAKEKKKKKREKVALSNEQKSRKKQKRDCDDDASKAIVIEKIGKHETSNTEKYVTSGHKTEELFYKDSGRDSLESSKSEDLSNESMLNVNVKSLVDTFQKKKLDFKRQLVELQNNSAAAGTQKRVNIVKTIIVHDSAALTSINTDSEELTLPPASSTIHQDITLDNSYGSNTFESVDTTKQKRKRVRKRKRVNKNLSLPNTTVETAVNTLIPRPLLTKTTNSHHVRFGDDSNEQPTITDDTTIKIEVQNPEEIVTDEAKDNVLPKTVVENEKLTEEFILKQPVMQNMHPRCGDIVAFKILRISESYTPEISSRIVGKINNYNSQSDEVTFDIIYGEDQCVQHEGKFSISSEEKVIEETNNKYNSTWANLLEPRLLFP